MADYSRERKRSYSPQPKGRDEPYESRLDSKHRDHGSRENSPSRERERERDRDRSDRDRDYDRRDGEKGESGRDRDRDRDSRYSSTAARGTRTNGSASQNPPSKCVGVFGLSIRTTERDLEDLVTKHGRVEKVVVVYDQRSARSRGFAFVYMDTVEDARAVVDGLNGVELHGRNIRVDYSLTSSAHDPTPGQYMGFKDRRPSYRSSGPGSYDRFSRGYEYYNGGGGGRYDSSASRGRGGDRSDYEREREKRRDDWYEKHGDRDRERERRKDDDRDGREERYSSRRREESPPPRRSRSPAHRSRD